MIRALYSLFMWTVQPLLRAKLRDRAETEPGYAMAIEERFGRYLQPAEPASTLVWIHAVSLGETRAAAVLIASLRRQLPDFRLLLTHGTATGRDEGSKLLQATDIQVWQPWDTPGAVGRFLTHFKPQLGILMETEVWPNMVAICGQHSVPLTLANARLSAKSLRQALRLAWLARPAYRALTAVWAQTEADAVRLEQLGATVVGVWGNLKFDAVPDTRQLEVGRARRQAFASAGGRLVLMFASSREGEEADFLRTAWEKWYSPIANDTHNTLEDTAKKDTSHPSQAPAPQLLIVPRHPQRFGAVAHLIQAQGFEVSRRSAWTETAWAPESAQTSPAGCPVVVWLGDSLGEMSLYYGLADIALLGGSFEPLGGQNLIEAAACGCPVIMGPHTFNFAEAAMLATLAGAAQPVKNMAEGLAVAESLGADSQGLESAKAAAESFSHAHRGAADKLSAAICKLLGAAPSGH